MRIFASSLVLALACGQSQPAEAPSTPVAEQPVAPPETGEGAAEGDTRYQSILELNRLDGRRPVPLQPMMAWHQKQNMAEHLVAIQRINAAAAEEDWDAIAAAGAMIESSPQMQQMCEHMGAGAPGFTELALEFHSRADAIGEAARAQDLSAVLRATAHTLDACTSCHLNYRQDVVDAETWMQRTGSNHQPDMMHGTMHEAPEAHEAPHEAPAAHGHAADHADHAHAH